MYLASRPSLSENQRELISATAPPADPRLESGRAPKCTIRVPRMKPDLAPSQSSGHCQPTQGKEEAKYSRCSSCK